MLTVLIKKLNQILKLYRLEIKTFLLIWFFNCNNFFKLNNTNYNNINLNNQNSLFSINEKITENRYKGTIKTEDESSVSRDVFFKFSPLLDPYKYLAGKYDISDNKNKLTDVSYLYNIYLICSCVLAGVVVSGYS